MDIVDISHDDNVEDVDINNNHNVNIVNSVVAGGGASKGGLGREPRATRFFKPSLGWETLLFFFGVWTVLLILRAE